VTDSPSVIVLADDDRITREFLAGLLRGHGHVVETFADGQEVLDRVAKGGVDVVLMDVIMPRLSGLEACRLLKSMRADSFLPVLLVTVKSDSDSKVEGLRIGADDYVTKPFDEKELIARVSAMLRIKRLHDEMQHSKQKLEDLAVHDELTGVYNYRYLHSRLTEEFRRAERYQDPLTCVMVDIDFFKHVNDLHGHSFGDEVLRGVAQVIKAGVREVDVVARSGGDEFLLIVPSTHQSGALVLAERTWKDVAAAEFKSGPHSVKLTVSIGIASFPSKDVRTKDALLKSADQALYQAKREGRNRICLHQHVGFLYKTAESGSTDATGDPKESR
jgi:diguanylate cyclase (GGDEF)-like protein